MNIHFNELIRAFVLLFAVIDPIGAVPVFLDATNKFDALTRRRTAVRATFIAAGILLFFIVVGQPLIEHMEISLPAFQASGGLVLLIFALTMIFGNGSHGSGGEVTDYQHVAVFPLAIPGIATPGAILSVVLLTDNNVYGFWHQAATTGIVLLILAITMGLLLIAPRIQKAIGKPGITVITKIMGLLLCGIAMESILAGIKAYYAAK